MWPDTMPKEQTTKQSDKNFLELYAQTSAAVVSQFLINMSLTGNAVQELIKQILFGGKPRTVSEKRFPNSCTSWGAYDSSVPARKPIPTPGR